EAAALAARREERLAALVAHARSRSAFYRRLYAGLDDGAGLASLPPVAKPELMAHFDEWTTDPAVTRAAVQDFVRDPGNIGTDFLGRYVVVTTSGSTGEPALLVQDRRALAVMSGLVLGRLPGLGPRLLVRLLAGSLRPALLFASGGHFLSTVLYERRLRAAPLRGQFSRFLPVQEPLPQLVRQLNRYHPAAVASYPSGLEMLAGEQAAGRLRIAPAIMVAGGEQLLPAARGKIEAAFGCPVLELYGASEASPLTLPCRYGSQHVNSDWFILEPVDAAGRPVPPGELSCSLLLTNLANFVQPLIRYELADAVALDPRRCRCGSPLPTLRVEGRTDEILRLAGPQGEVPLLPMALATVVEETPGVGRFQLVQTGPAALSVRLEPLPGWAADRVWAGVRTHLRDFLRAQGLPAAAVHRASEGPQLQPRSGKLRHVFRAPV
ncbi:phenylacetate--CoA ligase family protein, partial [Arthrobacter sp. GCM10027362]|uniref:phenylacetate--CoA ligase family protein n=1 Tax=Arthrobacter sp. GCM10027362 TaxID=3273379 RepID=UPI0036262EC7